MRSRKHRGFSMRGILVLFLERGFSKNVSRLSSSIRRTLPLILVSSYTIVFPAIFSSYTTQMQFSLNTLAFALFTSASALKITSPVKGDIVSTTGSFEVTWESVVTDVGNFSISARKSGDSSPSAETQVTGLLATSNKYAYVRGAGISTLSILT